MQTFSGLEYLKIDIANSFGLDNLTWDERINWTNQNESKLESLVEEADKPSMFYAGVQALQSTIRGEPIGYPISLDATSSGLQILACLASERRAAKICNVIDTGKRENAYTYLYQSMGIGTDIEKDHVKKAIMTSLYGSTAEPKSIFNNDELLKTYYNTMIREIPGVWCLNKLLISLASPTALEYSWILPDNFHVITKVKATKEHKFELFGVPMSFKKKVNAPIKGDRSMGANVVHSVDAYVNREMTRRCMFDLKGIGNIDEMLKASPDGSETLKNSYMVDKLWKLYEESGMFSSRVLEFLDNISIKYIKDISVLRNLVDSMPKKNFNILSIHDSFRCHPNYGNDLRKQYNNILSEICKSNLLNYLIKSISNIDFEIEKVNEDLYLEVLDADYAIT